MTPWGTVMFQIEDVDMSPINLVVTFLLSQLPQ